MSMGGIYIRDMEMPTDNTVLIRVFPASENGECYVQQLDVDGDILTELWAVHVPPHGRLIDAEKLGLTDFEIILCQKGNPFKNALEMLLDKIENAPTIIPADEGE